MPGFIDLVTLRLSEAGEGTARRNFRSFKDDNGDIVMPCKMLLRSEQAIMLETF